MRLTPTESVLAEAGIIAAIGAVFAVLNLYNPGDMALGARMAFYIGGSIGAWIVVRLLAVFGTATAKLVGLQSLWGYAITIPLSTAVISWAVLWWRGGPELAAGEAFARVWPSTILVGLGFFALFYVLYARADAVPAPARAGTADLANDSKPQSFGVATSPLHERLPPGFPALLALSVEDHYVRAHASDRSEMVLMSLAEAIELVPAEAGERVHRSWWVARAAVAGHKRDGRDTKLILKNGLEVPVSRDKVGSLREAGWLA